MKPFLLLLVLLFVISACSSSKQSAGNSVSNKKAAAASTQKSADDGLSFATAVVITKRTETAGVQAEHDWIKQHYENYTVKKQALNYHENKPFDVITITLADGSDLALYFDISKYFGKF